MFYGEIINVIDAIMNSVRPKRNQDGSASGKAARNSRKDKVDRKGEGTGAAAEEDPLLGEDCVNHDLEFEIANSDYSQPVGNSQSLSRESPFPSHSTRLDTLVDTAKSPFELALEESLRHPKGFSSSNYRPFYEVLSMQEHQRSLCRNQKRISLEGAGFDSNDPTPLLWRTPQIYSGHHVEPGSNLKQQGGGRLIIEGAPHFTDSGVETNMASSQLADAFSLSDSILDFSSSGGTYFSDKALVPENRQDRLFRNMFAKPYSESVRVENFSTNNNAIPPAPPVNFQSYEDTRRRLYDDNSIMYMKIRSSPQLRHRSSGSISKQGREKEHITTYAHPYKPALESSTENRLHQKNERTDLPHKLDPVARFMKPVLLSSSSYLGLSEGVRMPTSLERCIDTIVGISLRV